LTKEDVVKEFREREILDAARKIIARHGIQGTTIDRVAEMANVAKGTIYLYFPSKDDLVQAALLTGLRAMTNETLASDDPSKPPLERIRNLILADHRTLASNQDFLKTLLIGNSMELDLESASGREFVRVYRAFLDFTAAILREAVASGAIRSIDPDFAAFMLGEMITGSLRRRLLKFTASPLEADAEAVAELFLKGVQAV
jgi:TetR/AcrR family transcriptional regulator, fatty acid metabolism regulator protein